MTDKRKTFVVPESFKSWISDSIARRAKPITLDSSSIQHVELQGNSGATAHIYCSDVADCPMAIRDKFKASMFF